MVIRWSAASCSRSARAGAICAGSRWPATADDALGGRRRGRPGRSGTAPCCSPRGLALFLALLPVRGRSRGRRSGRRSAGSRCPASRPASRCWASTGGRCTAAGPALCSCRPWRLALGSPVAASVAGRRARVSAVLVLAARRPMPLTQRLALLAGALPGAAELCPLRPCRDRGTGLDHAAGSDAPRARRGLLGRGIRAAACSRCGACRATRRCSCCELLEPGGRGRGLPPARRRGAGGAAAADARGPDRRPTTAACCCSSSRSSPCCSASARSIALS